MVKYSNERKEYIIKQLLPPTNCPVSELSEKEGIPQSTLYNWRLRNHSTGGDMASRKNKCSNKWGAWLLFVSAGTLICCALPILLVSIGLGAVAASIFSTFPFFVTLTRYKIWVFIFSAMVLILGGWLIYRSSRTCPSDPELRKLCASASKWNVRFLWIAVIIWCIGFFATYVLTPLSIWFGF